VVAIELEELQEKIEQLTKAQLRLNFRMEIVFEGREHKR
jgi:hypothetical protein